MITWIFTLIILALFLRLCKSAKKAKSKSSKLYHYSSIALSLAVVFCATVDVVIGEQTGMEGLYFFVICALLFVLNCIGVIFSSP
ncbi:hypothetical protein CW735_03975 [Alteromonas sp. MB-3u-76]|nr:hypothetical protein CW735_03975 [Alteromonas sp. MB-3u-76]